LSESIVLQLPPEAMLAQAVEANVRWSMRQILDLPETGERQGEERVKLVGAIYEIESGRVRFVEKSSAGGACLARNRTPNG
jgi:carbonic anhydrase